MSVDLWYASLLLIDFKTLFTFDTISTAKTVDASINFLGFEEKRVRDRKTQKSDRKQTGPK